MQREATSRSPEGVRLAEHIRLLRRRWWAVVLCAAVAAVAAYGFSSAQTPQYESTSQLFVKDPGGTTLFNSSAGGILGFDPERLIATQIEIIKSQPIVDAATSRLKDAGFEPRIETLKVTSVPQTNLINVAVTTPSPSRSRAAAGAMVDSYLAAFRKQVLDELSAQARELQPKIGDLKAQIAGLDNQIRDLQRQVDEQVGVAGSSSTRSTSTTTTPDSSLLDRLNALKNERESAQSQLATYQGKLDQIQVDSGLRSESVLLSVPPGLPTTPVSPKPVRTAVIGLVIGVMLGIGLAFLVDFLDDSIRTRDDALLALDVPSLGFIPKVADWRRHDEARVLAVDEPESAATEAFRALRTNVRFAALSRDAKVIMVTSPGVSEGKTFITANLAAVAAEAGQKVVVVDGDLRRPRLHRYARLSNEEGLTTAMLGERLLMDLLRPPRWERVPPGLLVMTSGPAPPNPSELLSLRQVGDVLATLRAQADLVLVDSAPVVPVTDSAVLAGHCDAVLMVARAPSTSKRAARHAMERLRAVEVEVTGFVLNAASLEAVDVPYYYYGSYAPSTAGRRRRLFGRFRRSGADSGSAAEGNGVKTTTERASRTT